MPGADRDGLTAGPADRLQAVGGAIVALDSGLGHMSEYLVDDGTHLTQAGIGTYAALIRQAICGH